MGCVCQAVGCLTKNPTQIGEVGERLMPSVLKTDERASVPWVRIPPSLPGIVMNLRLTRPIRLQNNWFIKIFPGSENWLQWTESDAHKRIHDPLQQWLSDCMSGDYQLEFVPEHGLPTWRLLMRNEHDLSSFLLAHSS